MAIPDVLGENQRAALVVAQLASLQQEAFQLDLQAAAGALPEDAQVPGRTKPDGSPLTFAERKAELQEAQDRLWADHGSEEVTRQAEARATGSVLGP